MLKSHGLEPREEKRKKKKNSVQYHSNGYLSLVNHWK